MSLVPTVPIASPRKKKTTKEQEQAEENKDPNKPTRAPDFNPKADESATSEPTKPPVSPRSSQQTQQHNKSNNKNRTPITRLRTEVCTTEDETANTGSGTTRKLPPTPTKRIPPSQGSTAFITHEDAGQPCGVQHNNTVKSESHQAGYSADAGPEPETTEKMGSESQFLEGQNPTRKGDDALEFSSNKGSAGQDGASKRNGVAMGKSFPIAWSRLKFEIRCQGQAPIIFDATDLIGPPAKLQFALCSPLRKDISLKELKKQNILFLITNDSLVFTYIMAKQVNWKEEDVKNVLINTLMNEILDDVDCLPMKKDSERGYNLLETIKKKEPALITKGSILIYTRDNNIFIVGSKRDIQDFERDVVKPRQPKAKSEPTESTQSIQVSLKWLTSSDIQCLIELDLLTDIENTLPGVKISGSSILSISGPNGNVYQAVDKLKTRFSSIVKKEIEFKNPVCAKAFINNNDETNNKTLCDFVKCQVLKSKKAKIQKCYIEVERQEVIPKVMIHCLSKEEADAAADIVANCLHSSRTSKVLVENVIKTGDIKEWSKNKKIYVFDQSEKEYVVVTTCDVFEQFNKVLCENIEATSDIPIPNVAVEYFAKFGKTSFETAESTYHVSVSLTEKSFVLSGKQEDIKLAKKMIKNSYDVDSVNITSDKALIDQKKSQLEEIAQKYQCCWNVKFCDRNEDRLLKDVEYKASWLDHTTNAKLTVIEGCAARIEFDVLLVFVTDSLYPVIAEAHLEEAGIQRFAFFSMQVGTGKTKAMTDLGMVGLCPQDVFKGSFKSKEVMYLVVQKSTQIQGLKEAIMPPNLRQSIMQAIPSKEVLSVGIPLETDNLNGTFSETEFCELLTQKWMADWSKLKDIPELFICSTITTAENVVKAVDKTFKSSRGFSRRMFSTLKEDVPAGGEHVHVEVKMGDLLNSKADVIVNTTARNLDLREGFISKLILKHAGNTVQEECLRNHPKGIEDAEVAVTGPGDLAQFKNILHSSLRKYYCWKHDKAIDCVKNFVKNCLYKAERLSVASVAFPALGTGTLDYPRRDVAAAMFDAVEEYKREAINPRLRYIYFTVYGKDKLVCEAFRNEESRRRDQVRSKMKASENSAEENCLKKTITIYEVPVVFTVRVNVQYPPSHFVVMNFNESEPGTKGNMDAFVTVKSASEYRTSWNDRLVSHQLIFDDKSFRKMVQEVVAKTEEDRITGLVFYPLTSSSCRCSVGEQIHIFIDEVQRIGNDASRKNVKKYLREIWFAVDESGFTNAESQLVLSSGISLKSMWSTLTRSKSWEKFPLRETVNKVSVNIIGPDKATLQSAISEMKDVLHKKELSQHGRSDVQKQSDVKPSDGNKKEDYSAQGAGVAGTDGKLPSGNKTVDYSSRGDGPDVKPLDGNKTEDYSSQGARPKQTGTDRKSAEFIASGVGKETRVKDSTNSEDEPSILDAFEVTANVNQGIVDYLKKKGADSISKWKEQICKVFQVQFDTTTEKVTIRGSFFQVRAFQDYLNNDFPKYPEETSDDKRESDQAKARGNNPDLEQSELETSAIIYNSADWIVYQYKKDTVQVSIYKGDLTKVKVDCIVSSATAHLTGAMGIEKAVMDAAGSEVKKECSQYRDFTKVLVLGKHLMTVGGKLKCRNIIHYVMPVVPKRAEAKDAIVTCIGEAEKHGFCSLAFPALGSGIFGRVSDTFGNQFYDAVSDFTTQRSTSSIKDIHFVDKSDKSVSSVLDAFTADFDCLRINQTIIYAAKGDVTAMKADAIVVFQDSNFTIRNDIAKRVADLSGDHYSQDLEFLKDQSASIGSVYRTKARGDLSTLSGSVLHAVVLEDKGGNKQNEVPTTEGIRRTVKEILGKSENLVVVTLGIPIFELEELNGTEYISAMAELVFEYFCTTEVSTLKEVHFLSKDVSAVKTFVACLQKQILKVDTFKRDKKLFTHSAMQMATLVETMV